jgi:hypothetical protein
LFLPIPSCNLFVRLFNLLSCFSFAKKIEQFYSWLLIILQK